MSDREAFKALAHSLLNHVAVVSSYIELLKGSGLTEDQNEMCDEMSTSVRSAIELCRDLESRLGTDEP